MKKIICSLIMAACCTLGAKAQLADGFYHFKNTVTGRYISINDTDPGNYKVSQSGSVNMQGIRTYIDYDTVAVSPSCVIFVRNLPGGGYDLVGQGSSLYSMANQKLQIYITANGDGSYKLSGTAQGVSMTLNDRSPSNNDGYVITNNYLTENWYAIPINTVDEYIGVRPSIKTADGAYYGTIFAGFNFRLASPGMAAFYISNAGGSGFDMQQIEDEVIPASTPVIIRCNSSDVRDNLIEPVIGGYTFDYQNWLGGVYCSVDVNQHRNKTPYDPVTMRLLGLSDNGELAFTKANLIEDNRLFKDQFLMANRAYLKVPSDAADVLTLGGYNNEDPDIPDNPDNPDDPDDPDAINAIQADENTSTDIYTLTGVRLTDKVKPLPGIYVKNGKKIIIR